MNRFDTFTNETMTESAPNSPRRRSRTRMGCLMPLGFLVLLTAGGSFLATRSDAYGISATTRHPTSGESFSFGFAFGSQRLAEETLTPYIREITDSIEDTGGPITSHHNPRNPYQDTAIVRFMDRSIVVAIETAQKPDAPDGDISPRHISQKDLDGQS